MKEIFILTNRIYVSYENTFAFTISDIHIKIVIISRIIPKRRILTTRCRSFEVLSAPLSLQRLLITTPVAALCDRLIRVERHAHIGTRPWELRKLYVHSITWRPQRTCREPFCHINKVRCTCTSWEMTLSSFLESRLSARNEAVPAEPSREPAVVHRRRHFVGR